MWLKPEDMNHDKNSWLKSTATDDPIPGRNESPMKSDESPVKVDCRPMKAR